MQTKSIPKMRKVLAICLLISMVSCVKSRNDIESEEIYEESDITFSPTMNNLIDSFIVEMKEKSKINSVNGHIRFIEAKNNNEFKIYMSTFSKDTVYDHISIDDYFTRDGFVFCVDYNLSKVRMNNKHNEMVKAVQKMGEIKRTRACESEVSWLIQLNNDTIQKINKRALDIFGPECSNCLEWGGYITEDGVFVPEL